MQTYHRLSQLVGGITDAQLSISMTKSLQLCQMEKKGARKQSLMREEELI